MNKDNICEALQESKTKAYLFDETTSFVFKNSVKIFSILILIHQLSLKDYFIKMINFKIASFYLTQNFSKIRY